MALRKIKCRRVCKLGAHRGKVHQVCLAMKKSERAFLALENYYFGQWGTKEGAVLYFSLVNGLNIIITHAYKLSFFNFLKYFIYERTMCREGQRGREREKESEADSALSLDS